MLSARCRTMMFGAPDIGIGIGIGIGRGREEELFCRGALLPILDPTTSRKFLSVALFKEHGIGHPAFDTANCIVFLHACT